MKLSARRFSSFLSLALAAGTLAFSGCHDEAEQIAAVADSSQQRLDAKDKEIATLRNSEKELEVQLAELKGRLAAMEAEVAASRAKPVDAAAIARELAPLLATTRPAPTPAAAPVRTSQAATPAHAKPGGVKTTGGDRRQIPLTWEPPPTAR